MALLSAINIGVKADISIDKAQSQRVNKHLPAAHLFALGVEKLKRIALKLESDHPKKTTYFETDLFGMASNDDKTLDDGAKLDSALWGRA